MGIDPRKLGKHAHAAMRREAADKGRCAVLDSGLEARFVYLLKERRVASWKRDQRVPGIGTGHRADFAWANVSPKGERKERRDLYVFIDGQVHGIREPFADTLRCVNLCALLPPDVTVFRFADSQLELGAEVVGLYLRGKMAALVEALRRTS